MATETLPKGFLVRPPTMEDLKAVSELITLCDLEEYGTPDITEEDTLSAWQAPHFNLETDARVVIAPEGQLVGYGDMAHREHAHIYAFSRVHPDYRGRGIGTHLLRLAEAWARPHISQASPGARVSLSTWTGEVNQAAQRLFVQEGYKQVRSSWHMEIEMAEAPPAPEWPEGVTLRTIVPGQDERMVFEMIDEAFSDHWGYLPGVFEEWKHWHIERESFDPTLNFLAFDGKEIAGGSLCTYASNLEMGWVDQLAVRRPWRRKGLGMALLLHSFGEFYRRGQRKVGLGVDSQNLTGATRLYERAGMHVARQSNSYEKELRAGKELRTQSIAV